MLHKRWLAAGIISCPAAIISVVLTSTFVTHAPARVPGSCTYTNGSTAVTINYKCTGWLASRLSENDHHTWQAGPGPSPAALYCGLRYNQWRVTITGTDPINGRFMCQAYRQVHWSGA